MAAAGMPIERTAADDIPGLLSHVSVGSNGFERAFTFGETVPATPGRRRIVAHRGAVAFGKAFPEFRVRMPTGSRPARTANGTHFGFLAPRREAVDASRERALKAGAEPDGEPGPRHADGEPYVRPSAPPKSCPCQCSLMPI